MARPMIYLSWHSREASEPGGSGAGEASRKVGTPQGTTLGNPQSGRPGESATENRPRRFCIAEVDARVKRWGKSPPAARVTGPARQAPSGARPSREGQRVARPTAVFATFPGRPQEMAVNRHPREIATPRKTGTESRLQARSPHFSPQLVFSLPASSSKPAARPPSVTLPRQPRRQHAPSHISDRIGELLPPISGPFGSRRVG